jgi:hypothetical protein
MCSKFMFPPFPCCVGPVTSKCTYTNVGIQTSVWDPTRGEFPDIGAALCAFYLYFYLIMSTINNLIIVILKVLTRIVIIRHDGLECVSVYFYTYRLITYAMFTQTSTHYLNRSTFSCFADLWPTWESGFCTYTYSRVHPERWGTS